MGKIYHANNHKKVGVTILVSDKIDFKQRMSLKIEIVHNDKCQCIRKYNNYKHRCT